MRGVPELTLPTAGSRSFNSRFDADAIGGCEGSSGAATPVVDEATARPTAATDWRGDEMESLPQEHPARDELLRSPPPDCEAEIPRLGLPEAANDTRMSQLVRTIEHEIIPRLMLAHRSGVAAAGGREKARPIGVDEVQHFAKLMLAVEEDQAFDAVVAYRMAGTSIETIYLDLLAPTARYLGVLWEEDLCSFTDVTVGLGRLQRVLRELSPSFGRAVEHPAEGRSVLLLPCPGEQHTFGLVLVGEFFRRQGWNVSGGGWTDDADAGALVRAEWFDAIGFSLGAEVHLRALTEVIREVKHETCNPHVVVLVGGPLFAANPGYIEDVGADGMTIDGREAPALAERLIAAASRSSGTRRSRSRAEPA